MIDGVTKDYELSISEENGVILLTDANDSNRVYTEITASLILTNQGGVFKFFSHYH